MPRSQGFYEKYLKRPQDFCLALSALLLLSIPLMAVAYRIRRQLGSPVIFTQTRTGISGSLFTIYKFRTMTDTRDAQGNLLDDALRLNTFGKWLRATSIDELPELWNVIRGHMSLIGPRPLLPSYLPLYSPEKLRRHQVRPGLSGLAQVSGRNTLSWEDKFKLDIEYLENISFLTDWKIIFRTLKKVLIREGISSATSETMEEFRG